tara:strand:+ start:3079 stop:3543 length:465 start_codon:yes stop_codon:yes gene_type:complete
MIFKIIIIVFVTTLFGCGFELVNQNYFKEYKLIDVNITGEKRIVYLLRNNLREENKNASKNIKIDLNTNKTKKIREKNIQNEITKYEISIRAEVDFNVLENNKSGKFSILVNSDYNVSEKYSDTLNNEKKVLKNLVNDLSDQIIKNLQIKLNEL